MKEIWLNIIVPLIAAIGGGAIGSIITIRAQAKKEQIQIQGDQLRVEFRAIRRDKDGYFIPGAGRISLDEVTYNEYKRGGGKVAFMCENVTALADMVPNFVIVAEMPL
jgi:hypothetical protein